MRSVDFEVIDHPAEWLTGGTVPVVDIAVDGVRLVELVRAAELPHARAEQQAAVEAFAPEPAPLLAGAYMPLPAALGWPSRHFLGEPAESVEIALLGCTCGCEKCWDLLTMITVTSDVVTWSGFRNNHRDWDLSVLGSFSFARRQYEEALRNAVPGC